jgi:hypothetical protein
MKVSSRKSRKTLSLSRDAVAYLESYRTKRRELSLSGAVEAIIRERKEQEEADKVTAQIRAYYDSLTSAELDESEAWGSFVESEMADSEA